MARAKATRLASVMRFMIAQTSDLAVTKRLSFNALSTSAHQFQWLEQVGLSTWVRSCLEAHQFQGLVGGTTRWNLLAARSREASEPRSRGAPSKLHAGRSGYCEVDAARSAAESSQAFGTVLARESSGLPSCARSGPSCPQRRALRQVSSRLKVVM
jgi:hypothetical protein